MHSIVVAAPAPWETREQQLVRHITERLDTTSSDADRFVALAKDLATLAERGKPASRVEELLEVVAERHRAADVMFKYSGGTISRTAFLSYISAQRWPTRVRSRLEGLSMYEVTELASALDRGDIEQTEQLLRLDG